MSLLEHFMYAAEDFILARNNIDNSTSFKRVIYAYYSELKWALKNGVSDLTFQSYFNSLKGGTDSKRFWGKLPVSKREDIEKFVEHFTLTQPYIKGRNFYDTQDAYKTFFGKNQ